MTFLLSGTQCRDCDECFEPNPVSKRDKWLLDRDNGNVLAVAMRALSEGCGADIAKCEGNDPLHDFDLDDGTPTPTANHDYGDYNQMLLTIPSQVPDRIDNKEEEEEDRREIDCKRTKAKVAWDLLPSPPA